MDAEAINPLDSALKSVKETRLLLEKLIVSSESFDYPTAKAALGDLQKKAKNLARLQAKFERLKTSQEPRLKIVRLPTDPPTNWMEGAPR